MALTWIASPDNTCFTAARAAGIVLRVEASGEKNGVREWFGQAIKRDGAAPVAIVFGADRERLMADLEAVVGA